MHCIAHRLELSFADTLSDVPVLKDVKEMLQGIWKHYHYSAKAVRELEELAESMEVRAYKAVKADDTRCKFVAIMHLLLDIVDALSKVSLSFQEDGITISRVQDNLTALLEKLESFKERPGQHLNSFLMEVGDGNTFKGIELQRDALLVH